ncbi:hypothetical protein HDU90_002483 [Geranomyces variabilis]|nr:hypothetical protein HDU90_002483 [Geranomyces variabilis]
MASALGGKRIHIVTAKLAPDTLAALRTQVEANDGVLVPRAKDADVVITKLSSAARVAKYLDLRGGVGSVPPVATVGWLDKCIEVGEAVPLSKEWTIDLTAQIAAASADPHYAPPFTEAGRKRRRSASPIEVIRVSSSSPPPKRPCPPSETHQRAEGGTVANSDSDIRTDDFEQSSQDSGSGSESSSDNDGNAEYDRNIPVDPSFKNVGYECLRKHPLNHPNKELVELLGLMEKQREVDGEMRSALSYRRAISALISYPRKIRSWKEARKIKGVGDKIAKMARLRMQLPSLLALMPTPAFLTLDILLQIREYLKTGTISACAVVARSAQFRTISYFAQIYGVGPTTARQWYAKGYRSLESVLDGEGDSLPKVIRHGIELFPDFQHKMSRADVEEVVATLETVLAGIAEGFSVTPVGGYRRGKEVNGDCDVVITHPEEARTKTVLRELVDTLTEQGYIKHILWYGEGQDAARTSDYSTEAPSSSSTKSRKKGTSFDQLAKAFVAFRQPSCGVYRQVDLIIAPPDLHAVAVCGWTGSKQFERGLRNWCAHGSGGRGGFKGGLRFSSHGLFDRRTNKRIECRTEQDIFDKLQLEWIDPTLRNA